MQTMLPDLLLSQVTDPFRIGLVIALLLTTLRTERVTGTVAPLVMGLVFVAVIIPLTLQSQSGTPLLINVAVGLVANVILLAVAMAGRAVFLRLRG